MATWIAHLRIAERLLPLLPEIDATAFYIGSIGPDCGEPTEDSREFSPSVSVTHWSKTGLRQDIDGEAFFSAFLKNKADAVSYSLYLGYYLHLICDILWTNTVALPNAAKFQARFDADETFIDEVKRDWRSQDTLFLERNPDFFPLRLLLSVDSFKNSYLDYYPCDAFEKQLGAFAVLYGQGDGETIAEHKYLSENDMDSFVDAATKHLLQTLHDKGITVVYHHF
ncbi:MAG: zinc dependent phospholipase C family protein [Oscillospiraceae bacterium]|nr:zinc dependent phospholipase C family protein [Oscillospiraceae bacterium]